MKSDRQTSRDGWMCKQPWFIAGLQSHGGMSACVLFLCFYKVFYMCICPHVRGESEAPLRVTRLDSLCMCACTCVCVCINSIVSLLEQDSEFLWVTDSVTLAGERGWGEHRAGTFSVICRTAGWEEWVRRREKKAQAALSDVELQIMSVGVISSLFINWKLTWKLWKCPKCLERRRRVDLMIDKRIKMTKYNKNIYPKTQRFYT